LTACAGAPPQSCMILRIASRLGHRYPHPQWCPLSTPTPWPRIDDPHGAVPGTYEVLRAAEHGSRLLNPPWNSHLLHKRGYVRRSHQRTSIHVQASAVTILSAYAPQQYLVCTRFCAVRPSCGLSKNHHRLPHLFRIEIGRTSRFSLQGFAHPIF